MSDFAPDKCPCGLPWDQCPWRWDAKTFTCPRCSAVSHNRNDVRERYCGRCHMFLDDGGLCDLEKRRPAVQAVVPPIDDLRRSPNVVPIGVLVEIAGHPEPA